MFYFFKTSIVLYQVETGTFISYILLIILYINIILPCDHDTVVRELQSLNVMLIDMEPSAKFSVITKGRNFRAVQS